MTLGLWVAVAVVGGAGAVVRTVAADRLAAAARGDLALGVLVVNVIGAFALGALSGAGVNGDAALLAGTAFLGSLTTFSTWMLDATERWDARQRTAAAALLTGGLALGLLAVVAGRAVGVAL